MSLSLPTLPQGSTTTVSLKSSSYDLVPTFGGGLTQRVSRVGSKWSVEIVCRPMLYAAAGAFLAVLAQGGSQTILMDWPQPGLTIGSPGSPQVNGSGQTGSTLVADGFTPGYANRANQFFSIVHNGVRYLHQVTTAVTANGSGQATLAINPMLKVSPADNATLEFASPKIEGWLQGNKTTWTIDLVTAVGLTFSLEEVG